MPKPIQSPVMTLQQEGQTSRQPSNFGWAMPARSLIQIKKCSGALFSGVGAVPPLPPARRLRYDSVYRHDPERLAPDVIRGSSVIQ